MANRGTGVEDSSDFAAPLTRNDILAIIQEIMIQLRPVGADAHITGAEYV